MNTVSRMVVRGGWMIMGGFGCGHSHAEQPAIVAPSAQHESVVVATPDAGVQPRADAATRLPLSNESIETEAVSAFMPDHFLIVSWARDSVIDGDLEALRQPLRSLANYTYETVVPGGWMRGIAQLQSAARLTAEADNLTVAASGVAAMTRVCGQCHQEQGHPLRLFPAEIVTKTPKSDDLPTRMHRHSWASERLWEGLMAPSDQLWQAGAAALAHAPMRAPKHGAEAPTDFAQSLATLRDLGLRATQATSADERSNVYGLVLAVCADCHADAAIAGD